MLPDGAMVSAHYDFAGQWLLALLGPKTLFPIIALQEVQLALDLTNRIHVPVARAHIRHAISDGW